VKHAFNPADQTAGVLDDENSSSDESQSSDSSDDDSDATRGGRHPIDTTGLKKEERIESSGSPNESSEDSDSEVYDSSEDDKDGDDDTPIRGLSAEETNPVARSSFKEIPKTPSGKPYNMFRSKSLPSLTDSICCGSDKLQTKMGPWKRQKVHCSQMATDCSIWLASRNIGSSVLSAIAESSSSNA
jgi:hypothetical protein